MCIRDSKIAELVKAGKVKEISDMRDETDLNGLQLTLDLKRGVDADKLLAKLFKATPLEDSFSANFNIRVSGQPRVMGVREILKEWTAFRVECVDVYKRQLLEVTTRFELVDEGFADPCLTTWPRHQI